GRVGEGEGGVAEAPGSLPRDRSLDGGPRLRTIATTEREPESRAVGVGMPVEHKWTAHDEVARHGTYSDRTQAPEHQEGVLVDERGIASAVDYQVASQPAVRQGATGEDRGVEAMSGAEPLEERERPDDLG